MSIRATPASGADPSRPALHHRRMVRSALVGAGVVVLVLALLTGLLWIFQRSLIYLPDAGPVPAAAEVLPGARDVVLTTSDGLDLGGWFLPADDDAPAVLVANGNAGHRGHRAPLAEALHDAGLSVLLFDYRGYGGNPGSPSERGLALDVRAARDFLIEDAACRRSASSTSGRASAPRWSPSSRPSTRPPGWSCAPRSSTSPRSPPSTTRSCRCGRCCATASRWPSSSPGSTCPTTVVYGREDSIVPPGQSRAVADAAGAAAPAGRGRRRRPQRRGPARRRPSWSTPSSSWRSGPR